MAQHFITVSMFNAHLPQPSWFRVILSPIPLNIFPQACSVLVYSRSELGRPERY